MTAAINSTGAGKSVDRKSGSAGMPRPSSYAVFCLKKKRVIIVRAGELDANTPQTPGMTRAAAITHARTGANKLWAGTVTVQPAARTGAHHHGELETVLYIVRGRARFRWGDHLEHVAEAGPGD